MTYKTVLVHCDAGKATPKVLAVAADVAQRFDARLVALHARAPFEIPGFYEDGFSMGPLIEAHEERVRADEAISRGFFDKGMKGRAVAKEWRAIDGHADEVLAMNARYADLVVVGQTSPDNPFTTPDNLPEAVAMASGRPTLVVPHSGAGKPVGKKIMLCWNASRECARAASDAMPFLTAAEKVIILVVEPKVSDEGHGAEPGADVAMWLAKHGAKVTVQREIAPDADVASVVLSRAADQDIDLIVMGVYGHSRLREWAMGGASRAMLDTMTVPVLMSH
jgi:nucleotide-binding universal stress UspA family protein